MVKDIVDLSWTRELIERELNQLGLPVNPF